MRWLPAKPPNFKEALVGGAVSGLLLIGLKIVLYQVIKHTDVGSFYGSSLTLVLVLFWIYFAMQAFLYGAELAAQLAKTRRANSEQKDSKLLEVNTDVVDEEEEI